MQTVHVVYKVCKQLEATPSGFETRTAGASPGRDAFFEAAFAPRGRGYSAASFRLLISPRISLAASGMLVPGP